MTIVRPELAQVLDFTLLKPEAQASEIEELCRVAVALNTFAVCVSPTFVDLAKQCVEGSSVKVASVVGFPTGAHRSSIKALEATFATGMGADEIDMVANLSAILAGNWKAAEDDIASVRSAMGRKDETVLKVILETALLNDEQIVKACEAAEAAGANFVKTSTGYHAAGGASVHAVELMARTVGGRLGVKASGGIRSAEDVDMYLAAGATRIGTSSAPAIVGGGTSTSNY